ncbi:cytochrome P450 315a1, mitochondrial [Manduca sexta]|uniref:Cholesterol side-chain cleavage enzyme, mitochondrial n=1 Tax=Manduca sexta TaxID=7130 RepID=Q2HZZ4_MANSE|nr:cytochrome P450 315a1, mitochondrial [Manduca sexta]XP_030027248.1 cytochrome P450 315a1, mitochondrial [Manduca sexta]XP_037294451.1 cytochrome P450 315a1, mitochondrial [Manduca sexta]ABC96070.1 cytochrome P450 CYP315A1 [Manduca sexta]KAG6452805.1 hypothetical protein O3G_MSEX007775 [Manduca sexta]KAG6452806.1 hypothetical protein O3G_MSEX007775 [Manduca sexta]KAG6452807.1 hypothetical protein O3G_MSEX007775 [Manduca sexta]
MHRMTRLLSKQQKLLIFQRNAASAECIRTDLTINEMPHPKSMPILGTKLEFFAAGGGKKLHEYIDNRHKQLGSIFCENLGGSADLVFISDPTLMKTLFLNLEGKYPAHILPDPWILYEKLYGSKRGLFFMNGEEWLNNRRIMNKHLLKEDSEKWLNDPVKATIKSFINNWKTRAEQGNFIPDLETEFYRLSTDVIIAILLGSNSSIKTSKQYEMLLCMFSESVKNIFQTTTKLYALPVTWCQRINLKVWRDFKECVDMSLFLAHKIVTEILNRRHENDGLIKRLCEDKMSDEDIIRIVADFVIAAGDTTAYTSLWTLLLMAKNKDYVNNELPMKDINNIKHVVKEAMRLYPVAPFLTRILPKESILGPYKLNEGTPVIASIYTSGRDINNFSRPEEFLPYRWDRNDPRKKELMNHNPSASLPFALGSRSCIGKKIAMLQITELMSQIVKNFHLECLNKTPVNILTSQVLVPDKNIDIQVSLYDSSKLNKNECWL